MQRKPKQQWHQMITGKQQNCCLLSSSTRYCLWFLTRASRNVFSIARRFMIAILVIGGLSYLLGTDFFLDSFVVMETSLGMQLTSKTSSQPHTPEFPKSWRSSNIQILERNPPPKLNDISMEASVHNCSNLLALPPAPSQEWQENKSTDDTKIKSSKPLTTRLQ